jgi:hypothetical protein
MTSSDTGFLLRRKQQQIPARGNVALVFEGQPSITTTHPDYHLHVLHAIRMLATNEASARLDKCEALLEVLQRLAPLLGSLGRFALSDQRSAWSHATPASMPPRKRLVVRRHSLIVSTILHFGNPVGYGCSHTRIPAPFACS